jgi:TolB-like protein
VDYGVRTYAVQGVGLPIPEVKEDKQLIGHLWAEIQRRGVIRAAVAYVVAGLMLVLLLRQTQNWISLPDWSLTAILASLLVGFPIAMYLAWNYEKSPEGFVRTTSQQSWRNPYSTAKRKPLTGSFFITGLILVIAFMYFYQSFQSSGQESETSESNLKTRVIEKSIVVLPFADISVNKDQEYFSDGMMEEILNHLVKIEDLKVISRTTAMQYKGTTKTLQEIAQELGVATVLEGSVRKNGDQVRITVQLIQGDTDIHLWSESYDRQLTNIFEVQSDVAQKIAAVLQAEVNPEVKLRIESQPTNNAEAYNLYLQSRSAPFLRSRQLLHEVIKIDSNFAAAYSGLGRHYLHDGGFLGHLSAQETIDKTLPFLEKALQLDENDPGAYIGLANISLYYEWDFLEAGKNYNKALELNPSDLDMQVNTIDFLLASGQYELALKRASAAINAGGDNYRQLAFSQFFAGQHQLALKTIQMEISDGASINTVNEAARMYLGLKMYHEAVEIIETKAGTNLFGYPRTQGLYAVGLFHIGQLAKSNQILNELKQKSNESPVGSPAFHVAMIYAHRGENDMAFQWLEKAYQDHEVEMYWLKVEPPFEPLHNDSRWQDMLDKVGFPK